MEIPFKTLIDLKKESSLPIYVQIANEIIKSINENYKNFLKTPISTLDISKFEALKVK